MNSSNELAEALLVAARRSPPQPNSRHIDQAALDTALQDAYRSGRNAHARVALPPLAFASDVGRRLVCRPQEYDLYAHVKLMAAADVYLAIAITLGVRGAAEIFVAELQEAVQDELRRKWRFTSEASFSEAWDTVRERILLGGNSPSAISEFDGSGTLRSYLSTVAWRTAHTVVTRRNRQEADDEKLLNLVAAENPEVDAAGALYGPSLNAAIRQAITSLGASDRLLLRFRFVEQKRWDWIARRFGVDRSTASRRTDAVLAEIRRRTLEHLRLKYPALDSGEGDSLVRLVEGQLHLSIERLLGKRG